MLIGIVVGNINEKKRLDGVWTAKRHSDSLTKVYEDSMYEAKKHWEDSFYKTPDGIAQINAHLADSIKNVKRYEKERIATETKSKRLKPIMDKFSCDEETAESIKKKQVWIGMTYEMLVYERGKPDNINRSNYGHGEQYQACWMDWRPMCFYFDDSHVITAYN